MSIRFKLSYDPVRRPRWSRHFLPILRQEKASEQDGLPSDLAVLAAGRCLGDRGDVVPDLAKSATKRKSVLSSARVSTDDSPPEDSTAEWLRAAPGDLRGKGRFIAPRHWAAFVSHGARR